MGKEHLEESEIYHETEIIDTNVGVDVVVGAHRSVPEQPDVDDHQQPQSKSVKHLPILLIVEDNHDLRSYIRDIMKSDYRIKDTPDGESGLQQAVAVIPDLIISDVMMPGMDGFELCKKLKTDERSSHIPVILLTARAGMESKLEGLETGADDYIIKPFDAKELKVRVKNLIEQRRQLRERFRREVVLKPEDITLNSADENFLQRAIDIVNQNIDDPDFKVTHFIRKIGMSRMQLHRKLQALTDQSASEFVRVLRLKRAALLLQQRQDTISEIAYKVGFNKPSYFAECFRKQFGVSPSEYVREQSPK